MGSTLFIYISWCIDKMNIRHFANGLGANLIGLLKPGLDDNFLGTVPV